MKVQSRLSTLFVTALSQSLSVDLMQRAARAVIEDYDVYRRSGFPESIPIPRADAAKHILKDFLNEGYFLKLIESLIDMTSQGNMGREVRIPLLPRIVAEIEEQGYRYSAEKGIFVESAARTHTMGWGTLREGRTYEFALLRIDIAGSSDLVRRLPREKVNAAYLFVRDTVKRLVEKRDGRIWTWEGDGGLAAFYFLDKTIQASLCAMEIVHEMYLCNLLTPPLPQPLLVRMAVHAGPCKFLHSAREASGDTMRRIELLESQFTLPGSLTISPGVFTDLGSKLTPMFVAVPGPDNSSVYRYALELDKR